MRDTPFNTGLSDAKRERYACLAEEAGEVVQAVGKILRHGELSEYDSGETNPAALAREIGDFMLIVDLMIAAGDIDASDVQSAKLLKLERFLRFTHYQPDSEDWRPGDDRK